MNDPQEIKNSIDEQLASIEKLPAMPDLVQKILAVASNPDVDVQKLAEEISHDAGITASVIKLSNSAYYRPQRPIRSIQEAIMSLGLRTVKNIVVVAASRGVIAQPLEGYRSLDRDLWDHSLMVAEVAGRICRTKKCKTPADVAFTAGVLHDVGKVVLSQYFRKVFRQVSAEVDAHPEETFTSVERRMMGYDHAQIGGKLLAIWLFPEELSDAISNQYTPELSKAAPELSSLVHIANHLALAAGIGVDSSGMREPLSDFALKTLRISDTDLESYYTGLPEWMQEIADLRVM